MIMRPAILVLALGSLLCQPAPAQRKKPRGPLNEKTVMKTVAGFLEHVHLTGLKLDDAMAKRAFKTYLESLDPLKIYFQRSDVEEFKKDETRLDDMLKEGRASFADRVFARYLQRVDERVATVESLLQGKFDFKKKEDFIVEPDERAWPGDAAAARDAWRKRLKSDMLALRADDVKDDVVRRRLSKRYTGFRDRIHKDGREEIVSRFINAFALSFDPHTLFMAPKPYEDFEMGVTGHYQGIGALLGEEDGEIIVRRVMPGGAVEKDGSIRAKDRIISVGQGDDGEMKDVVGWKLSEVVKLIRGPEGTVVRMGMVSPGGGKTRIIRLVRSRVQLEESKASSEIIEEGKRADGKPLRVGVIDLPGFYRDFDAQQSGAKEYDSATRDVERILKEFKRQDVQAVILDLRRNGGGFLPEAVGVAGLFIDSGPMVQVKGSSGRVRKLDDPLPGTVWNGPLVLLVSRGSASASEIVAGAIKDYRRGLIVGDETTHGKGTVQVPVDLADQIEYPGGPGSLGVLKLTIRQYFRPSGAGTQKKGVKSDVVIPSWTNAMEIGERELPFALASTSIAAAPFVAHRDVDAATVAKLRAASLARRRSQERFQDFTRRLGSFRRFRARHRVPLDTKTYMAQQAALDAGVKEEDAEKPARDLTFQEALRVTADYALALQRKRT